MLSCTLQTLFPREDRSSSDLPIWLRHPLDTIFVNANAPEIVERAGEIEHSRTRITKATWTSYAQPTTSKVKNNGSPNIGFGYKNQTLFNLKAPIQPKIVDCSPIQDTHTGMSLLRPVHRALILHHIWQVVVPRRASSQTSAAQWKSPRVWISPAWLWAATRLVGICVKICIISGRSQAWCGLISARRSAFRSTGDAFDIDAVRMSSPLFAS